MSQSDLKSNILYFVVVLAILVILIVISIIIGLPSNRSILLERRHATSQELLAIYNDLHRTQKTNLNVKTADPAILYLTENKIVAPYWIVIGYKIRGSEYKQLNLLDSRSLPAQPIPVVFVSQSFGHSDNIGEGLVCFTNGEVRKAYLPSICRSLQSPDSDLFSSQRVVVIPEDDERFEYRSSIESLTIELLSN